MRNLLGRLAARSVDDLTRIALAWRVPVTARDQLALVGQVYRELRDPRTVRDMWDTLPADERELVRLLAVSEALPELALTVAEIAALLEQDESSVRATAARLYHKGILAREGDTGQLPEGEPSRLFIPRELAQLFRRIQDEIDAGDVSQTPLATLIELLDDIEIEQAVETWGEPVVPGLSTRAQLIRQALAVAGDPQKIDLVVKRLGWDAKRIWWRLLEEPQGASLPLATAAAAAELDGDDPRHVHRLRQALSELEGALLAWHSYHHDGTRWLFIPAEIRSPVVRETRELARPSPLELDRPIDPPGVPPFAAAWDLLTLLRALESPEGPRRVQEGTRAWLQDLNRHLWIQARNRPPSGYLEFLVDLARHDAVVEGGDDDGARPLQRGVAWKTWRGRTFPEQMGHFTWWWRSSPLYLESAMTRDAVVERGAWPAFRGTLLDRLASLEVGSWYALPEVVRWLAAECSHSLGEDADISTLRAPDPTLDPADRREAAVALVIESMLRSSMSWLGLVHVNYAQDKSPLLQVTAQAIMAARHEPVPPVETITPSLTVAADGTIELHAPSPLRVWALTAFASQQQLQPVATYVLDETSLRTALAAGFTLDNVTGFLERESGQPVPGELLDRVRTWQAGFGRVWVSEWLGLAPDDQVQASLIRDALSGTGWDVRESDGDLLVRLPAGVARGSFETELSELLRGKGLSPTRQSESPAR